MKLQVIALVCLMIAGCNIKKVKTQSYYFIPLNYRGWVNILYADATSSNESFKFSNGSICVIRHPQDYRLKDPVRRDGVYENHFFYYSVDTLIRLDDKTYPKRHIFFPQYITKQRGINNKLSKKITYYSFYVTPEPLAVDGLSTEQLPENRITFFD